MSSGKKTFAGSNVHDGVYEGELLDGDLDARGRFSFANGDVYEGEWLAGFRHGHGKLTYANKTVQVGEFIHDGASQFFHRGRLSYIDGDVLEGWWDYSQTYAGPAAAAPNAARAGLAAAAAAAIAAGRAVGIPEAAPSACLHLYQYVPWDNNFGDEAGIDIIKAAAGCKALTRGKTLLGLGSTLHHRPGILWGTGSMFYGTRYAPCHYDARAVRGPLTALRLRLKVNKTVFGDPGLLLPALLPSLRRRCAPTLALCVVPHRGDNAIFSTNASLTVVFRANASYADGVHAMTDCQFVVSSSLHGIIFAEALGIPARWIQISGSGSSKTEGKFKYCDYYGGSRNDLLGAQSCLRGEGPYRAAQSLQEALALGAVPPMHSYEPGALLTAFPHDLISGCPRDPDCKLSLDAAQRIGRTRGCVQ